MSDIKEGDQVSWKYGNGNAEGTVAATKASGELAVETNGKDVKVNASEDNPAVHIAHNGNDVVKRESALTKTADATETGEPAAVAIEQEPKGDNIGGNNPSKEEGASTASEATKESEDKMDLTPDTEKVEIGEKRSREEDDIGEVQSEEEQAEKENGKEIKKAKLENGDSIENGHVSENGHADTQNGDIHAENGNAVKSNISEEPAPKKSRGPGRPRKGEGEPKQAAITAGDDSTISQRTRSKA